MQNTHKSPQHIKLISALGNYDAYYFETRHNVGFWFLDALQKRYGSEWKFVKKLSGYTSLWHEANILLFKPGKLMNINGAPIATCARFYNVPCEKLLIAYDDLDFQCGHVRLKMQGGHGGHNGMRDLLAHLPTHYFARLRIGIDRPSTQDEVAHYVLSRPTPIQRNQVEQALSFSLKHLDLLISGNYSAFQEQCVHFKPQT